MPNQNYIAWYLSGGSGAQNVAIRGNGNNLELSSGGGLTMTMDASQRVGIGTSSPSTLLHLLSTNSILRIGNSTSGLSNADLDLAVTNAGLARIWQYGTYAMVFGTNNTERMRITSAGVVTISNSLAPRLYGVPKALQLYPAFVA